MCSLGINLIHSCAAAKAMPHHPMDRLAQTTVGHHQSKYSMKALKQDWEISFEGSQGCGSIGMLPPSIVAEVLEVL
jgi:hypothetical protein